MFSLRADYRENRGGCVIDKLREIRAAQLVVPADQYELINETLTTGDYVIQARQWILIIERKTWEDLAASIHDGRIFRNHEKMLEAARLGCRIMYLIEGRSPSPEFSAQKVGGILVGNLMAKLDHFAMRDNVILEFTREARHTALRLVELGKHLATLEAPQEAQLRASQEAQLHAPLEAQRRALENTTQMALTTPNGGIDVSAIVKKKHIKPIHAAQKDMLKCIGGIGEKTAETLLAANSIRQVLTGQINYDSISSYAATELKELTAGNRNASYCAMLVQIKGVSDKFAKIIALNYSIARLVSGDPSVATGIASLKAPDMSRRIGDKLATRIIEHFSDAAPGV